MTSPSQLLLETLESSQQLRQYVRTFRLEKGNGYTHNLTEKEIEFIAVILALMDQLPNLSVFELDRASYRSDWILYLATRPSLRLSIIITYSEMIDGVEAAPQLPYTATSLSIQDTKHVILAHLVFHAPLQRLELPQTPIRELVDSHIKYGSPVLPLLQALVLSSFIKDVVGLLKCTPNLVKLQFGFNSADKPNFQDLKGVVPRLESFTGVGKILPYFMDGRPIQSVKTWGLLDDPRLPSLAKQLGSTVSIRTLWWKICVGLEYDLDYIATNCFHVQELRIAFGSQVEEVSVSHLSKKNHIITSYRDTCLLVFIN